MVKRNDDRLIELETQLRPEEIPWVRLSPDGTIETNKCAYCGRRILVGEIITIIHSKDSPLVAGFCYECTVLLFREVT